MEALYLQGFHRNVIKNWFLRHHASVAWHDLRGQGRASGGHAWAQKNQQDKLINLSSSTAFWDPSLTSGATSCHWCMTSQKPTFDDISMEPLHPVWRCVPLSLEWYWIFTSFYSSVERKLHSIIGPRSRANFWCQCYWTQKIHQFVQQIFQVLMIYFL